MNRGLTHDPRSRKTAGRVHFGALKNRSMRDYIEMFYNPKRKHTNNSLAVAR